MFLIGDDFFQH